MDNSDEQMTVKLRLARQPLLVAFYAVAIAAWAALLIYVLFYLLAGKAGTITQGVIIVAWIAIWFALGRLLWNALKVTLQSSITLIVSPERLVIETFSALGNSATEYDVLYVGQPILDAGGRLVFRYGGSRVAVGWRLERALDRETMEKVRSFWPQVDPD